MTRFDAARIDLTIGDVFDTPYEAGNVVLTRPDRDGNFDGLDSDRVTVQFHVRMVTAVYAGR